MTGSVLRARQATRIKKYLRLNIAVEVGAVAREEEKGEVVVEAVVVGNSNANLFRQGAVIDRVSESLNA